MEFIRIRIRVPQRPHHLWRAQETRIDGSGRSIYRAVGETGLEALDGLPISEDVRRLAERELGTQERD